MSNSIQVIFPYCINGVWCFDDQTTELVREPFVDNINNMLNTLTADLPDARKGFQLTFSAEKFPGYAMNLARSHSEYGGTWYTQEQHGVGWLCSALFLYFDEAPEVLYIKADALSRG